jgi:hypothetical protein
LFALQVSRTAIITAMMIIGCCLDDPVEKGLDRPVHGFVSFALLIEIFNIIDQMSIEHFP